MPRVYAEFEEVRVNSNELVIRRRDTRVYLAEQSNAAATHGTCVGAFFLQNPGSATWTVQPLLLASGQKRWPWGEVDYSREQLMPLICHVLDDAIAIVRARSPKTAESFPRDAYVQLLNLAYIRNSDGDDAAKTLSLWRQVLRQNDDRDDAPVASDHFRFVVFGWGGAFKPSLDGDRIAKNLIGFVPENTVFIFPAADKVRARQAITFETAGASLETVRQQLKYRNNYPCGAQHERQTYGELYRRAVSPVIADLLERP